MDTRIKITSTEFGESKTFNFPPEKSYIFDKLDEIFSDQKFFNEQIDSKFKDQQFSCYNFDKSEFDINDDLNNVIEEIVEAKRHLNRKRWSEKKKYVNKKELLEELIDANKFLNQAILRLGFTAQDVYEMHMSKSKENRDRQKRGY